MYTGYLKHLIILNLIFLSFASNSQPRKQTNWLKDKQSYEQRWRVGVGINIGEPTGVHVQFYRLCRICKQSIAITKRMSVDASVSQEGLILSKFVENRNPTWSMGGMRAGIDLKLYFRMPLNPYVGVGGEVGSRKFNGESGFYPDIVGRFGVEQKILGVKVSTTSVVNATLFIEGKFNKGLTSDFNYFLPAAGFRFHFL
ncbi:MAG TPA: hypothetical protein PL017_03565 [Tenuifilaceae bacterium]|nr:hypothetical protein [Tenuifilaceae bacterium]HPE17479.1 hypothetical protein [Tenuifilaceae bacterium]HPJ45151.1 hypothetical protein [Tenuifilaceae bacterium]HPQ33750.1 hypothetical protein [Tenuifilaceae bacterium]HRX67025.1 hypothetical protein [Tenuifilaceae bacterium]